MGLLAFVEECFECSDVFFTAYFPCVVVVSLRAFVHLPESCLAGSTIKIRSVETRHDFVFDASDDQHRTCYIFYILRSWVKESLDKELELGNHWHQVVDHVCDGSEAVLQDYAL